jgi:hypothetical protein
LKDHKEQILPNPPLRKGGKDLAENLAWLDYCLGETAAALEAVQDAALTAPGFSGAGPVFLQHYYAMSEAAAGIITLRGRARKWGKHET